MSQVLDLICVMAEWIKYGSQLPKALNDHLNSVVEGFGRSASKSECLSAALLMFFEADRDAQAAAIQRVHDAELNDRFAELVRASDSDGSHKLVRPQSSGKVYAKRAAKTLPKGQK